MEQNKPSEENKEVLLEGNGQALKRLGNELLVAEGMEFRRRRQEFRKELDRERASLSRVYVVNILQTVSSKALARIFKACSPIAEVRIGCYYLAPDSTCFAEIIFNDPVAYLKAEHLNGLLLEGRVAKLLKKDVSGESSQTLNLWRMYKSGERIARSIASG
ncbi:uncharacterized protein FOMMEDRAFT_161606 [Fomitiporia mediterranea MF3/22]|uniref:uncharacterized protein n=1 Tax=Fomitiporia mediterranea (strain MF3/22) TaxID=694068 RepID=UPI0004409AF8|nr:uncharacterized protein FOMMEDRAFT_161606 [Fomitiporia mediterranea MF3/22]EJC98770.1 hypothetical protein FOMMEDRAFT_161606 [Fomitiporia mediterranea MF3/22]